MALKWIIEILNPKTKQYQKVLADKRTFSVGRREGNDLVIALPQVSGRHFVVSVTQEGAFSLEDSGSKNGTYVHSGDSWRRIEGKEAIGLPASIRITNDLLFRLSVAPETAVHEAPANQAEGGLAGEAAEGEAPVPETRMASLTMSRVSNISDLGNWEAISVLDICGSSDIANLDDRMAYHLKTRMTHIAKQAFTSNNGSFYKSTGDGFLATYRDPSDALRAVLETLYHLKMRNQKTKNLPVHVRIGLHAGITYLIDEQTRDLHGNDVNVAFRLESIQKSAFDTLEAEFPEQDRVLCTKAFYDKLKDQVISLDVSFVRCGMAALKGIKEPIEVYWVR